MTAANGVSAPQPRAAPAPPVNGKHTPPSSETPKVQESSSDTRPAAPTANDSRNIVRRKLTGYVGFANLPNQWHRKSVRKGFNFNVMVVGKFSRGGGALSVPWVLTMSLLRRVRVGQINVGQHAVQHVAVPSQGAQGA